LHVEEAVRADLPDVCSLAVTSRRMSMKVTCLGESSTTHQRLGIDAVWHLLPPVNNQSRFRHTVSSKR
jgi:hypothetical protein